MDFTFKNMKDFSVQELKTSVTYFVHIWHTYVFGLGKETYFEVTLNSPILKN